MAMLAEPRQRKRYNLVPRGKALYEDENRFGTKMLEKMGWEKGTGLGAKKNGSTDFIRIRYKNDSLGLGFQHRDDQWTQHEECFNGLLKNLNGEENDDTTTKMENGNESEDDIPRVGLGFSQTSENVEKKPKVEKLKEKISGISLEERSKQSRARVHYKKFTKGKDLAQYSEKDLANIFGKKAVDEQQAANDFYQQLNNSFGKTSEQTVTEYFETKMEAFKNGKNGLKNTENGVEDVVDSNDQPEEITKKKKKEKKDRDEVDEKVNNTQAEKEDNGQIIYSSVSVTDYFKMKMEALKNRKNGLNNSESNVDNKNTCEEVIPDEEVSKKKKKKKKDKDQNNVSSIEQADDNINTMQTNEGNKKEKKSKKCDSVDVEDVSVQNETKSKKKKDKEQNNVSSIVQADDNIQTNEGNKKENKSKKYDPVDVEEVSVQDESKSKKKKDKIKKKTEEKIEQQKNKVDLSIENSVTKKRKYDNTADNKLASTPTQDVIEIDLTEEPRKKKQKKNKTKEKETDEIIEIDENDNETPNVSEDQNITKEKKKKKKSKSNRESNDSMDNVETPSNTYQTEIVSDQPSEKPRKAKRKEVSSSAKNVLNSGVSLQDLNLDELKKKYNAFNIYPISSFCAEKFRNISLNNFTGSTLPQIEGYSLGPDIQLDVHINKNDEERITNLWNCVLNKYSQLQKPKKTYQHYVREVIKARKTKQKRPKLYVKTWRRKNAFQAI